MTPATLTLNLFIRDLKSLSDSTKIDVSIVIAAWNAAAFLPSSIACALSQSDVSLEVIVCDDASTDGTSEYVKDLGDPRVRYARLTENRGPAAARNAGLAAATGRWIAIFDADDAMESGRLSKLIHTAERNRADIVADNFWIAARQNPMQRRLHIDEALDESSETIGLSDYFRRNILFGSEPGLGYLKPLFQREFLVKHGLRYDENMRIGEDFALVADMLARGARFVRVHSAGYVYLTHDQSISHRLKKSDLEAMVEFDRKFATDHLASMTSDQAKWLAHHVDSLKTGLAFTNLIQDLKERDYLGALKVAIQNPAAALLLRMPIQSRLKRLTSIIERRQAQSTSGEAPPRA